jgi:Holliday junction resolvase RusA-like endonuclease
MPADSLTVVLNGPPMGKERVRVTKTGRAYTPERTLNFEARLAHAAQIAMAGRALFEGPLSVIVEAFMPIAESKPRKFKEAALNGVERPTKKPDWDNVGKMLDALNLIVWADDAQIVDGRVIKWYSALPRLVVTVQPMKQQEGVFA